MSLIKRSVASAPFSINYVPNQCLLVGVNGARILNNILLFSTFFEC